MKKLFVSFYLFFSTANATELNLDKFLPEHKTKIIQAVNFVKENVCDPDEIVFDMRYTTVDGNIVKIIFYENKKEIVWDVLVFDTENNQE